MVARDLGSLHQIKENGMPGPDFLDCNQQQLEGSCLRFSRHGAWAEGELFQIGRGHCEIQSRGLVEEQLVRRTDCVKQQKAWKKD